MKVESSYASLIPIPTVTPELYAGFEANLKKLKARFGNKGCFQIFENVESHHAYARAIYTGTLTEETKDLTPWEVAVLCDGGFSWFGGSANIYSNGHFEVNIYTD
jgi:hypothetical protein